MKNAVVLAAALAVFIAAVPPDPDFVEGEKAYFQNRFAVAKRLIKGYLQKYPNSINDRAYFYLGNIESRESNFSVAVQYYRTAIELNESEPAYLVNLGNMYYMMRSFTNALVNYRKGTALIESQKRTNFDYATPYLHAGHTFLAIKDYTNAADWYETFLGKVDKSYYQYDKIREVIDMIRKGKIPVAFSVTNTASGIDISVTNIDPSAKKIEGDLPKTKFVPKDEDIVE